MSTRSIFAYKTRETRGRFELGVYVHSDGYPTHMGKSWWEIARHPMFAGNLAAMAEYFIIGNPYGWSLIDWQRDITKKPVSVETNVTFYDKGPKFKGDHNNQADKEAYWAARAAHEATLPLVSYRARRWDIMKEHGYANEAEAAMDSRCTEDWRWGEDMLFTPEEVADSWCEWLYIIDIDARTLEVRKIGNKQTRSRGVFDLDGPEPDWKALEG